MLATCRGGGHLERYIIGHQYYIGQAIRMGSKEKSSIDSCAPTKNKLDGAIGDEVSFEVGFRCLSASNKVLGVSGVGLQRF